MEGKILKAVDDSYCAQGIYCLKGMAIVIGQHIITLTGGQELHLMCLEDYTESLLETPGCNPTKLFRGEKEDLRECERDMEIAAENEIII